MQLTMPHDLRQWGARDHGMDTAPDGDGAILRGRSRKVHVSVHGASIVRTENGKITAWADDYDGLTARRTALAAHFKVWVEL
jgi:hypothetical protein